MKKIILVSILLAVALASGCVGEQANVEGETGGEAASGMEADAPPMKVKNLEVKDAHQGKINLTWAPCNATDISHYKIYRMEKNVANVTGTSYQDTGMENGKLYAYEVSAVDEAGQEGEKSGSRVGKATDVEPPEITKLVPENGAVESSIQLLGADYNDTSGIDRDSVTLYLNGEDITEDVLIVTEKSINYNAMDLTSGEYNAKLEVSDVHGNKETVEWSFTIS